jgi:hypothetical protein
VNVQSVLCDEKEKPAWKISEAPGQKNTAHKNFSNRKPLFWQNCRFVTLAQQIIMQKGLKDLHKLSHALDGTANNNPKRHTEIRQDNLRAQSKLHTELCTFLKYQQKFFLFASKDSMLLLLNLYKLVKLSIVHDESIK